MTSRHAPLVALALLAGCGTTSNTNGNDGGLVSCTLGNVMPDFVVDGVQRDDNMNGTPSDDPIRTMRLSDYAKEPGTKVLAILVAAEWCAPCQQEQPELVAAYNKYKTANAGVAMLEAIETKTDMSPADVKTIAAWSGRFKVPFDMTFDPTRAFAPCSDPSTYPQQIVVRLSDMTVQWTHTGYEAGTLEAAIDQVLAP